MKHLITLGPKGTYSDLAASKISYNQLKSKIQYTKTLAEICPLVLKNENSLGILPVENSATGIILLGLDNIVASNVKVIAEIIIPIYFSLIYHTEIKNISRCYSQTEAFNQCTQFIQKYLKKASIIFTNSNTQSARYFQQKKKTDEAAIIPTFLSKNKIFTKYKIKQSVENYKNNTTRFWVIKKSPKDLSNIQADHKISIYIEFKYDKASMLYSVLAIFHKYKFNMSMLSSRPIPTKKWTYGFFIDFKVGNEKQIKNVFKLLKKLEKNEIYYSILGNYKNLDQLNLEEKIKLFS